MKQRLGKGKQMETRYIGVMTEGDLIDYVRAEENLAAMRKLCARNPWKGKQLRNAMNAEARVLKTLAMRYSAC